MAEITPELIRPPFFSCANAVGACVANVAGEVGEWLRFSVTSQRGSKILRQMLDTIEILQNLDLATALKRCTADATERAVRAGAKRDTVKVVEMENLPVQVAFYHTFNMRLIKCLPGAVCY